MGPTWLGGLGWSLTPVISCTVSPSCLCFSGLGNLGLLCSPSLLELPCAEYVRPQLPPLSCTANVRLWKKLHSGTPALSNRSALFLLQANLAPCWPKKSTALSSDCLRPQGLFTAGLLSLPENRSYIQGLNLNMVTSSLQGHIPVSARWGRLPAKLKEPGGECFCLHYLVARQSLWEWGGFLCLPRLLPPA